MKSEHLPPEDARSCGIMGNQAQPRTMQRAQFISSGEFQSEEAEILSFSVRERGRGRGAKNAPLLDPSSGGARRAAKRLRLRVLRRVVVLVAPRSGGRRRVLHRLPPPFLPVAWKESSLGFRVCLALSPAAATGALGRSVGAHLRWRRGFNGGRRMPSSLLFFPLSRPPLVMLRESQRNSTAGLQALNYIPSLTLMHKCWMSLLT